MRRALIVTAGTAAGLAAALTYTPHPATADAAALADSASLGTLSAPDGSNAGVAPAADPAAADPAAADPAAADPAAGDQTAADATVAAPATSATPSKAATKKKAAATATATKKAAAPAAPATAPNTARSASPSAAPAAKPATKPAAAKPAPKPTPTPTVAAFKDYLGAVAVSQMGDTVYGKVQVTIRVSAGKVTALAATFAEPHSLVSKSLSNAAMLQLRNEVITAQSASVANVSGATYTSAAFKVSLQSALHAAGLA